MRTKFRHQLIICVLGLLVVACGGSPRATNAPGGTGSGTTSRPTAAPAQTGTAQPAPTDSAADICPPQLGLSLNCQTPQSMRIAYGLQSLIQQGYTGKGQTIIDIVSFGSPTLQQDMNVFDKTFGLPPITLRIISPLNVPTYDPNNDRDGWVGETTLDVEIMHALAPDAGIVVLVSPVAETEGTVGLPEFRQLEEYVINNKLGNIISQSWGASEVTLKDAAGQQELQKWDAFYKQATTQQRITFFSSSGDHGSTDAIDLQGVNLSTTPTTSFPADDAWVTSVGGTALQRNGGTFQETAWSMSGGGFSSFYTMPSYQQSLPAAMQGQFKGRRGVPDVAGNADPRTGLAFYAAGQWDQAGGTSASAPLWSAFMAIANQMAGHPLGFINAALYKIAASSAYTQDFHDITAGNNTTDVNGAMVPGYTAVQGWDAITGLGSPNGEKLIPDLIRTMNG